MSFPENCIRGIPNNSFLNDDGSVGSHLFYFDLTQTPKDGWFENSINWEDDDSVVEFTLRQEKLDGNLQFNGGLVIVPTEELNRLRNRPTIKSLLSYRREPLPDNPFHGDLLLRDDTSKPTMKLIAAGLALAVLRVIPQH
jgi:hypothetical protein